MLEGRERDHVAGRQKRKMLQDQTHTFSCSLGCIFLIFLICFIFRKKYFWVSSARTVPGVSGLHPQFSPASNKQGWKRIQNLECAWIGGCRKLKIMYVKMSWLIQTLPISWKKKKRNCCFPLAIWHFEVQQDTNAKLMTWTYLSRAQRRLKQAKSTSVFAPLPCCARPQTCNASLTSLHRESRSCLQEQSTTRKLRCLCSFIFTL